MIDYISFNTVALFQTFENIEEKKFVSNCNILLLHCKIRVTTTIHYAVIV